MGNYYVEDYEQVTGKKPDNPEPRVEIGAPLESDVEAKVVEPAKKAPAKRAASKATTK